MKPTQPDEMDWRIIDLLRRGHQPNNTIARRLKVSEGMIRRRLKRLRDAEILTIRAQINPEVLEHQLLAVIGVNVAESRLLKTKAEEIAKLPGVLSVGIVSGRYDLLVELLTDSNNGLVRFLTETLSQVAGITKTESFLLLKTFGKFV